MATLMSSRRSLKKRRTSSVPDDSGSRSTKGSAASSSMLTRRFAVSGWRGGAAAVIPQKPDGYGAGPRGELFDAHPALRRQRMARRRRDDHLRRAVRIGDEAADARVAAEHADLDRKSTRLNSS